MGKGKGKGKGGRASCRPPPAQGRRDPAAMQLLQRAQSVQANCVWGR